MTGWGGTPLPRREVPPPGVRAPARREPATQRTRTGPGWVTDPRTLRRVRDALASLPRRQP